MDLRDIILGSMDWINVAQDRDQWRALLNAAKFPKIIGKFLNS
jgi:hypothetical protein